MNKTSRYLRKVKDNLLTTLDLLETNLKDSNKMIESATASTRRYYTGRITALEHSIDLLKIDIQTITKYIALAEQEGE